MVARGVQGGDGGKEEEEEEGDGGRVFRQRRGHQYHPLLSILDQVT